MTRRRARAGAATLLVTAMLIGGWAFSRQETADSLDALVDDVVAQGAPGALVVVRSGGATSVVARGLADGSTGLPMDAGARFRAGSITKTFVAALILDLVADGRLQLEDPVERWLPELHRRGDEITVRELLSHTSGLPDYVDDPRVLRSEGRRWRPEQLVRLATERTAATAQGHFAYASTNYLVLGLIAERAGGAPLGRLLATRIFEPLDLLHTSYTPGEIPGANVRGHRAPSHQGLVTGEPVAAAEAAWWAGAAGGIVSTAGDIERFYAALLRGRVLRPALLRRMETLVPAGRNRYGLGLAVFSTACGPAWGHTGNVQGTIAVAWNTRDASRQVVVVVNTYPLSPDLEAAVRRVQIAAFCGA